MEYVFVNEIPCWISIFSCNDPLTQLVIWHSYGLRWPSSSMIYLFKMVISLWESQVGNPQTHLGTKGSWESLVDSYENMGGSPASHIWLRGNDNDTVITTNIIVTITITTVAITNSLAVNSDMNNMMMKLWISYQLWLIWFTGDWRNHPPKKTSHDTNHISH